MNTEEIIWKYLDGEYTQEEWEAVKAELDSVEFTEKMEELQFLHGNLSSAVLFEAPDNIIPAVLLKLQPNPWVNFLREYRSLLLFFGFLIALVIASVFLPAGDGSVLTFLHKNAPQLNLQYSLDPSQIPGFSPYLICLLFIPGFYYLDRFYQQNIAKSKLVLPAL